MIQGELPTPWRFVEDTNLLSKNQACANCDEEEFVYQTDPSLLPSFAWSGTTFYTPTSFWLRTLEGGPDINLSAYLADINAFTIGSTVYVTYHGETWTVGSPLVAGKYQCEVSDGINTIYSEPIRICESMDHCIALLWTHSCDIGGIPYSHLNDISGPFINYLFVEESPILQREYETEKEESTNLLRQKTVLYQSQERVMRFKTDGPNHIVKALKAMELHDGIDIYVNYNNEDQVWDAVSNNVFDVEVIASDIQTSECTQELEIKFKQDDAIITGICCVQGEPDACLTSCYTVDGFAPEGECVEGTYYIDDVDSGIIVRCVEGVLTTVSTTCTYVLDSDSGNHMYYDGDLWRVTPDLDFNSYVNNGNGTATINIDGYTIPGTWVYIQYSCDNVTFSTYPVPFSAVQLALGISITIPTCNDTYYLKCTSQNHECTYDVSDTIQFTPE